MATPSEIKLLLAIATSGTVSGINWEPVGVKLGCNKRAAAERWRSFKTKLPLPAGKAATDSQAKLLLAIVGSIQVSGVDWEKVGQDLGCNKRAAAERWRAFKVKRAKKNGGGEGEGQGDEVNGNDGAAKKVGKAAAKGIKAANDADGADAKKTTKRKAEEDSEEEVAAEGGPVGGVNRSAKKRVKSEETKSESVKEDGDKQDGYEGEGSECENDEFFEAEDGSGEGGPENGNEGDEYQI